MNIGSRYFLPRQMRGEQTSLFAASSGIPPKAVTTALAPLHVLDKLLERHSTLIRLYLTLPFISLLFCYIVFSTYDLPGTVCLC